MLIDGEAVTITSVDGANVRGFTPHGDQVRFVLTRVDEVPREACGEEWRFGSALLDAGALSAAQLRDAAELLAESERGVVWLPLRRSGTALSGGAARGL